MKTSALALAAVALVLASVFTCAAAPGLDARGGQFIWFSHFGAFEKSAGNSARETVLTSPVIRARINWDALVASWNADMPEGTGLKVEARAWHANGPTAFYTMALWSNDPNRHPRESVPGQNDGEGRVSTDTLILRRPSDRLQVRLTIGSDTRLPPKLKFLGLALTDTDARPAPLPANTAAWGVELPVPERSQMTYPNGSVLCSPTTVSMIMSYWSKKLARPDLDRDVPEIAQAIYDAKWKGTGNWPFNTAYAGSFRGMRGGVARFTDVSELEDWIARGIPVGLSLCYDRLRGRSPRDNGNGHLVVCVGFTADGDPIINDPGTSQNVRKIFQRKNLVSAWGYSRNTAYLIYPESVDIPMDRFGHWASWTARQRVRYE